MASNFTWGSTALSVVKGSYVPPRSEAVITETPLLPDPAALSAITTVIQQGGRNRHKTTLGLVVYTYAEYQAFLTDWYAGTTRTFTGADGYSDTMMIADVSTASRKIYPTRYEFSITLLAV